MHRPRGSLHSATALGDVSAHLTIGAHVVTRYSPAVSIPKLIASDERLCTSLPLGLDLADPVHLVTHLDAVRAALTDAVAAVPAEAVFRGTRGRGWSGGRPEQVRPVALAAFGRDLTAGDAVRRRLGVHHRLVAGDDHVVLELTEKTQTLPAAVAPARAVLLGGGMRTPSGACPSLTATAGSCWSGDRRSDPVIDLPNVRSR